MKKIIKIMLSVLLSISAFLPDIRKTVEVYADNPKTAPTRIYTLVKDEKVYVLDVDGSGYYLFLPSEVDISCLQLYSENYDQVLYVNEEVQSEIIDLSSFLDSETNRCEVDILIASDPEETMHLTIMKGDNLGSFFYKSDDIVNKGIAWIETSRNNKGKGTAVITNPNGKVIYSGKIDDIHIRGNSSLRDPKKGYRIKLDKKTALVGEEKGKKWVLLAMYKDPLRLDDMIMKGVANISGDTYSANETLVNLYYDGCYRGVYCLSEKNEIKSNRINITDMEEYYEDQDPDYGETVNLKTATNKYNNTIQYQEGLEGPEEISGGYLIEMNSNFLDTSSSGFFFMANTTKRFVTIDSPEYGSREAVEYISEYFQDFINAVYGSRDGFNPDTGLYYYDYCDLDSLVNLYLLETIASNSDAFWKSQYFYKDANDKMYAGPLWDMDLTFGTAWTYQSSPEVDIIRNQVLSGGLIRIPSFRARIKERYFEHYQSIMASLMGEDDKVMSFEEVYDNTRPNLLMDTVIWPTKFKCGDGTIQWGDDESLDTIAEYRIEWIGRHKTFLDSYFGEMNDPEETAHVYGDPVFEDEEYHKRACMECGEEILLEHIWDEGTVLKEATCTEEGLALCTCSVCGGTKEVTIPVIEHSYDDGVITKEATCVEEGIKVYTCEFCGATREESIPMTDHLYDEGVIKKEATCMEEGLKVYTCKVCGDIIEEIIPLASHTLVHVNEKEPTHESEGNIGYYICSVCGKLFKDETASDEIELKDTIIGKKIITDITRVYGTNRFGTSFAISDTILMNSGNEKHDVVILANGDNFADALAGSYLAAVKNAPIIITRAAKVSEVNAYIRSVLKDKGTIYVLGGTAAVPESSLKGLEGYKIKRLAGDNRYLTNIEILKEAGVNGDTILIATGTNYADSLSASATGLPMLLVRDKLNDDQIKFLKANPDKKLIILGGDTAVSKSFEKELGEYGEVERIAGDNRFVTSIRIAEKFFPKATVAILAYGSDFPDGLCGGPLANQIGAPLILIRNDKADIARPYTKERNITDGYALGGTTVLPDATVRKLFGASESVTIKEIMK